MKFLSGFFKGKIGSVISNILLSYVVFMVARIIFYAVNFSYFGEYMSWGLAWEMLCGALKFDTSAVIYVNAVYIVMALFPLKAKENERYYSVTKGVYITLNALALFVNLADAIYFQYTGRRTTATVFSEFSHEGNLLSIVGIELLHHWYLVLAFIAIVWGMCKLYQKPRMVYSLNNIGYYISMIVGLAVAVPLCICGIRGGIGPTVRPITISNANQYVNRPIEAALVLNTPFSIIRTIGKKSFEIPHYMSDDEMSRTFSPVHQPDATRQFRPMNVVVLIVESFGKEYVGSLNHDLDGGTYKGFTPFIDSLMSKSFTFRYSFSNGRKSIDGMPSVLSGIPMFVEPFFLTPASLNNVSSIAGELDKKGYYTAFFHGAPNGSMGFQAFARAVGFKNYYGLDEYKADSHRDGDKDFDGTWAIWDEPFLQYYCDEMSSFKQPFMTALFTASSHHPFVIPDEYKSQYPEGKIPIQKCIRYTDHALQRFFESAEKQPWFKNTLFVITADHTNQSCHEEYQSDLGVFNVPVIFYAPGDSLNMMCEHTIAQQIDIMPSVLGYLGYDQPFVSFGCNVFNTPADKTYAVSYLNGVYQYVKGDYLLQFDGTKVKSVYRYKTDRLLKTNLVGKVTQQAAMEKELKAIIQQYMQRMNNNWLIVKQ